MHIDHKEQPQHRCVPRTVARDTPHPAENLYPSSPFGTSHGSIPTGRDLEWQPLLDYRRNGVSETTIHGAVSWVHGSTEWHSCGGNVLCYGRSLMKPFMIRVFAQELAAQTTSEQKAIAVASHNGTSDHVAAAQSLLDPCEWSLLQTPLDLPLVQFGRQIRRPRRWYNNSSGQHAAVLRGCRLKGWPRVGYTLPSHPFYSAYIDQVRRFLGPHWTPLRVARDGDGFPTVSATVTELARCYAGLAATRNEDWIWSAMNQHPDLVGGFNRLDTTIMKIGGGAVLAKEGADGLLGMAIAHPDFSDGLGVVIKIAHGWNPQATWYLARGILGVLGIELRNPYPLNKQKAFIVPHIVPECFRDQLEMIPTWDSYDPDRELYGEDLMKERGFIRP